MVVVDFSGKRGEATLASTFQTFLSDIAQLDGLRPHTVRAYGYELSAAAVDDRFSRRLDDVRREDLDAWVTRMPAATSTVGRRVATFRRFFLWACRQGFCRSNPMTDRSPLRGRRRLPRPIREQHEQRALDAAIGTAPQPDRLIFTLLRETGMRVGEVLDLRWGDVTLDSGREALRVREAKNGVERAVVLGPTATPRTLRALRAARRGCQAVRARHAFETLTGGGQAALVPSGGARLRARSMPAVSACAPWTWASRIATV